MKCFLFFWALMGLICYNESMDRSRNKICYTAMTCIHTGKEKCGVDGGGNHRRFYDSCDMLELNCLKGKDYVKTATENCKNLPPIDDGLKKKKETDDNDLNTAGYDAGHNAGNDKYNNAGNAGNVNEIDGAIEGTLTVNDHGDIEGEIVKKDEKILETTQNNGKDAVAEVGINEENTGIEGEIVENENGSIEGELIVNDDVADIKAQKPASNMGNQATVDQQTPKQDGTAISGVIDLDGQGGMEGEVAINDEKILEATQSNGKNTVAEVEENQENDGIEGEIEVNEKGSIEGELIVDDDVANTKEQQPASEVVGNQENEGIEGEIVVNEKGSIEGELIVNDDVAGTKEQQPVTNMGNLATEDQQSPKQGGSAISGEIDIDDQGDIEGEIAINDENILETIQNNGKDTVAEVEMNQENTGIEGDIVANEKGSIEGELIVNDDVADTEGQQTPNQDGPVITGEVDLDEQGGIEGEINIDKEAYESK